MARTRTTKKLAQRIDLNYFKRATPLKRAKVWLSILLPLVALGWVASRGLARDSRVYSRGRLTEAHAVLDRQCAACHVQTASAFSAKAENKACLACHDGPQHHPLRTPVAKLSTKQPGCATCHSEHRGQINLVATANHACAECHANLGAVNGATQFAKSIHTFVDGHPEFAALRATAPGIPHDPRTIKLNHAVHMKPIRRGPTGPNVQLTCGNCHHAMATSPDLTYSDASYRAANVSYREDDEVLSIGAFGLKQPRPPTGREYMAPVKFANACAACHVLTFDKHFDFGVPHDTPEVLHKFLVAKFSEYVRTHPTELREAQKPERNIAGKRFTGSAGMSGADQWIAARVSGAEELLWRKTCKQCHEIGFVDDSGPKRIPESLGGAHTHSIGQLPSITPAQTALVWMPHAKFDHDAHRGFACESCHPKALTSSDDSEILLPGIAVCQKCHAPGPEHAESRCFECHTYHDWSQRKEVAPQFILPSLRVGH